MRRSTRLLLAGGLLLAVAGGLFYWGATTELTPAEGLTKADVMATIGQIAGGIGGVGLVLWLIAAVMRGRGA